MFAPFERSRGSETTGKSSFPASKSRKFDLAKWFKISTSCGISKRSILCDNDDSTTPFMTTIHSLSSSSDTSSEMGGRVRNNGSLNRRYSSRLCLSPTNSNQQNYRRTVPSSPTRPTSNMDDSKSKSNSNISNSTNRQIFNCSQSVKLSDDPIDSNYHYITPPSSLKYQNDRPYPLNPMTRGRNNNLAMRRSYSAKDADEAKSNFFPDASSSLSSSLSSSSSSMKTTGITRTQPFLKPRKKKPVWKSARDAKSGKIYYYEVYSRKTQWHKPLELASDSERLAIQKKERIQKEFFSSMEANIIRCMQEGIIPGSPKEGVQDKIHPLKLKNRSLVKKDLARPTLIKTISSMDVDLLAELTHSLSRDRDQTEHEQIKTSSSRTVSSPDTVLITSDLDSLTTGCDDSFKDQDTNEPALDFSNHIQQRRNSQRYDDEVQEAVALVDNLMSSANTTVKPLSRPSLDRRNTCGTLYVTSTMAAPDIDATIKCVCGVYRAHLLQAVSENHVTTYQKVKFKEYEIFNDSPAERGDNLTITNKLPGGSQTIGTTIIEESDVEIEMMNADADDQTVPSLEEITDFYRFVFNKAQMESDCIIVSLIYVERLLRDTNGGVWPNPKNWRSLLFSCMVMASKVWDDLSMWNKDFSHVCPTGLKFPLKRINELELALLTCLKFDVKVLASVYAKYYFLMRTMLIRSGLAGEESITMKPLDNEGAKKLEFITTNYKPLLKPEKTSQRSKSVGEVATVAGLDIEKNGDPNQLTWRPVSKQVNLEQVVNM